MKLKAAYQSKWNSDPELQLYIASLLEQITDLKEALTDCITSGCDLPSCLIARDLLADLSAGDSK